MSTLRLTSLSYRENFNSDDANPWELNELSLRNQNLIIGKNATGKSRIVNVINNLAKLIQQQKIYNGEWTVTFTNYSKGIFKFFLRIQNGQIIEEHISIDAQEKLIRSASSAKIYSNKSEQWQTISPPNNRLVLQVRRDKDEYPFLEQLISWAEGVRGLAFATAPNQIEIPGNPFQLTSLNAVPSALDELSDAQLQSVLKKLEHVGYQVEAATTSSVVNLPPKAKIILLKEAGLAKFLKQYEISQGMFRAFSLLTIIEFLRSSNTVETILVDDLGEGLDFERSKKLAELLFKENLSSKFQMIATSNDCFLMNAISLEDLTLCYRTNCSTIKCLNYANSKDKFESWRKLGLNNFDLFSSNFLIDHE